VSVLAIDTSSRGRVVCLTATSEGWLRHAAVREGAAVAEALPPVLASLLDGDITAVVVAVGPGSYTGVRAGMAAALGVAHSRGVPLHCIGSLRVIAAAVAVQRRPCWVAADAGRGAVYIEREDRPGSDAAGAAGPRRLPYASLALGGLAVFSADPLEVAGLERVDPAAALAAAVPQALAHDPVVLAGLSGVYIA